MEKNLNLFNAAIRGESTPRTPIWFMRQAGRYLPEYREVRKQYTFDEMLANADIATEITLQPMLRFDLDAAVIFADIMTILQGLEIPFNFLSGGPRVDFELRNAADIAKLDAERLKANSDKYTPFLQAIRNVRAALKTEKAVVGFAASPFTLLSYLIEGETSKTHNKTRALMASEPALFESLLSKIAACTTEYLLLQARAGVSAVQIFESWGDVVAAPLYAKSILPHVEQITREVSATLPVIFYDKGAALHLDVLKPYAKRTGAILSVDWRTDLRALSGYKIQGNLDPAMLESDAATAGRETKQVLAARAGEPGHVFNLGHGITPHAKLECVEAMVQTVQSSARQ